MSPSSAPLYEQGRTQATTIVTQNASLGLHSAPPSESAVAVRNTTDSDSDNARFETSIEQTVSPRRVLAGTPRGREFGTSTFRRLEEREGVILDPSVSEGSVRVRLVDPRGNAPDEEAEVDLEQFSPMDRRLVKPGALFFWSIGYVTRPSGRRELVLRIDLRRILSLPPDTEDLREQADALMEGMNWK